MGRIILIAVSLFAITLGIFIGTRFSEDALGLVLGVFLGVLASIPTSLGLIWVVSRRMQPDPTTQPPNQPSVLIINPATGHPYPYPSLPQPGQFPALPSGRRDFRVVGSEAEAAAARDDGGNPWA